MSRFASHGRSKASRQAGGLEGAMLSKESTMKTNHIPLAITLFFVTTKLILAEPLGTAFTYQGRLTDGGSPASGLYDFQFVLCDAATDGTALGTNTVAAAPVSNGLYTVALDFGSSTFNGSARWLALSVRTNGGTAWTALTPRLSVTPSPYSLYASSAGAATTASTAASAGSVAATNITGR